MKKVRHWLHILLVIVTCGIWLFPYVLVLATTEMFNRGYRAGKSAGRIEKSNEIEEERAKPKHVWEGMPDQRTINCRCVVRPIVGFDPAEPGADWTAGIDPVIYAAKARSNRYHQLRAKIESNIHLSESERTEYYALMLGRSRGQ